MKWVDVEVVSDVGKIPKGLPPIRLPDFSLMQPVIILELRGRNNIGATLTEVLESLYDKITKADGRFYLTELGENSYASFRTQVASEVLGGMHIRQREAIIGKSTQQAVLEAQAWLGNVVSVK